MWNIAGGSWAAPKRGMAARKQTKAPHIHHSVQPFSLIYLLSMQDLRPHTSAKTKGVSKPFLKFNQKHTGVPFPLATPAWSECDGLQSLICAAHCTNCVSIQKLGRQSLPHLNISNYPTDNVYLSTRMDFIAKTL